MRRSGASTIIGSTGAGLAGLELAPVGAQSWRWADAAAARLHVCCFGDSNSSGNNGVRTAWPSRLRTVLQRTFGNGGGGYYGIWDDAWSYTAGGNAWTDFTVNDFNATFKTKAPYAIAKKASNNTAMVATWTKPAGITVDRFEIVVSDTSLIASGNFEYDVDNAGTWSTATTAYNADGSIDRIAVTASVSTNIRIRPKATSSSVTLLGIIAYNGTTGCVVHDMAKDSYGVSMLGYDDGASGANVDPDAILDVLQPKLTIGAFLGADLLTLWNISTATYYATLTAFVTKAASYGDVILLGAHEYDFTDGNLAGGSAAAREANYYAFLDKLRQVCTEKGVSFFHLRTALGSYATANAAGDMVDGLHLSQQGQDKWSELVLRLLAVA